MSATNDPAFYRPTVYDWNATCDICLRPRSAGGHQKCSKKRQALRRREQENRNGN